MLKSLAQNLPKTTSSHLKTFTLDSGRSIVSFNPPSSKYLVTNHLPPSTTFSSLAPPLHWHCDQDETFHVISGTAKFTLDGRVRVASTGEEVFIPKKAFHTFCNASATSPLVIEFVLDPERRGRDEAYFRNVWGYREDCKKAGMERSLWQALLFMRRGGVVRALPEIPGPGWVKRTVGVALNFLGGEVMGRWILGYKDCYEEYYRERVE